MFTFEPGVALWSLLSFILVLFIVQRFIYPPIRKALDERKNSIEFALEDSKKKQEDAKSMFAEAEEKLRHVKSEAHKIISEAQEKAHQLEKDYEQKALAKYRELLKNKEAELHKMEEKFYASAESDIAQIVIKACQKILKFDLTQKQQDTVVQKRISELKNIKKL